MDAIGTATRAIKSGEARLMIAGGVESMSRAPFVMPNAETAFTRSNAVCDTTIGWRLVNRLMKSQYGVDSMPETAENVAVDAPLPYRHGRRRGRRQLGTADQQRDHARLRDAEHLGLQGQCFGVGHGQAHAELDGVEVGRKARLLRTGLSHRPAGPRLATGARTPTGSRRVRAPPIARRHRCRTGRSWRGHARARPWRSGGCPETLQTRKPPSH